MEMCSILSIGEDACCKIIKFLSKMLCIKKFMVGFGKKNKKSIEPIGLFSDLKQRFCALGKRSYD